jgi:hypothetical protein
MGCVIPRVRDRVIESLHCRIGYDEITDTIFASGHVVEAVAGMVPAETDEGP